MITRREMMKALAVGSGIVAADLTVALQALAEGESAAGVPAPPPPDKGVGVRVLMQQALPDAQGKQVTVVVVDYAPGAASTAHRHPGSTFGYVLDGAIESQSEPGKLAVYKKGEMFYEEPMQVHRVSRNASHKRRARLLAFLIMNKGEQLLLPADKSG